MTCAGSEAKGLFPVTEFSVVTALVKELKKSEATSFQIFHMCKDTPNLSNICVSEIVQVSELRSLVWGWGLSDECNLRFYLMSFLYDV